MRFDRFTDEAQEVAQRAAEIIQRYGHNQIDTEQILLGLIEQPHGMILKILEKLNVSPDALVERLDATLRSVPKAHIAGAGKDQIFITPRVKRIIELANEEANHMSDDLISTEHMFLAILTERNTPAARILESSGLTHDNVLETIEALHKKKHPTKNSSSTKSILRNNNVFIVHGHDEAMKEAVARTVEKLGLNAIVLHEKPNQGKTIIEKFTEYSEVGFAIVLLSPDDISSSQHDLSEKKSFRARQNVIFELGFFVGKLGRDRVISLYRQTEGFEIPSDYSGVVFIPFDEYHRWQLDIIRELKAAGYKLDANKLLE